MTEAAQLLVLTVAVGIDLHLTLLLLGAALWMGWSDPVSGLGGLASPPIPAFAAVLYALETFLERRIAPGLAWGALQLEREGMRILLLPRDGPDVELLGAHFRHGHRTPP